MSLVSIIVPTFNRAHLLAETLGTFQKQSHEQWECLVVDDGSSDDSEAIVKELALIDPRISWWKRPQHKPKGANACRNFGLENAKGDFIIFFDSDDRMLPDLVDEQLKSLEASKKNYSICQCDWVAKNGKILEGFHGGKLISDDPINDYIRFQIFWPINGVCYRKDFLNQNQLRFDESLQQSQEYDFHVRVLQTDPQYAAVEKRLLQIVTTEDSISHSPTNSLAKVKSSLRVRQRFLTNKKLSLKYMTQVFLLHDMHRIFKQQTLQRNIRASYLAGFYYLRGHMYNRRIFGKYIWKHSFYTKLVFLTYNFFSKGYSLLKKSNTFGYTRNS